MNLGNVTQPPLEETKETLPAFMAQKMADFYLRGPDNR